MGFLSNLFGGNKEDKALREAMAHIHRILDDEQFQLKLLVIEDAMDVGHCIAQRLVFFVATE